MGARIAAHADGSTIRDRHAVHGREVARVGSVHRVEPRDRDREVEGARAEPGDGLFGDLRARRGGRPRRPHATDRVVFVVRVPGVVGRCVHHVRRHDERRLGAATVLQHQAGSLRVDSERFTELVVATAEVREVEDVGEVVGKRVEVSCREIDGARGDAGVVDLRPQRGIGEARSTPDVVLRGEGPRQWERHRAVHPGDEDLLPADHRALLSSGPSLVSEALRSTRAPLTRTSPRFLRGTMC